MATDTVINRPAPFVEDIGKNLAQQTVAQTQVPVVTTGLAGLGTMAQPTQQAFETAEQFKQRQDLFGAQQRAALGFEQRQQALSGLTQQVAGLDPLQQQAQQRASRSRFFSTILNTSTTTIRSRSWYRTTICSSFYVSLSTTSY